MANDINQIAAAAYGATQKMFASAGAAGLGSATPAQSDGVSFSDLVRGGLDHFVETQKSAEKVSLDMISGKADINDVIFATQEASVQLETIVAIRDKVVQAYQSIWGMAI